jgi:hypothetical protein
MSTSLLKRAAESLKRGKDRTIRLAKENEKTTALAVGALSSTGAAVGAAFADQKMGNGQQWKVGPVPVVGIAGVAISVPALFLNKYPIAQAGLIGAGTQLVGIAAYRYLVEEAIDPGTP